MEQLIANRLFERAGIEKTPASEAQILRLLQSAREGHLCVPLEEPVPLELPVVVDGNRLYLQKNWMLETLILEKIKHLSQDVEPIALGNVDHLNDSQREAVKNAAKTRLAIFTGGPGTGKTYTASTFIRLFKKVAIAAPTGKAAANLEAALRAQGPLPDGLECESTTLHRLLKLQPGTQRFYSTRTIDADLVVIDEASMLDPAMMLHLLNAIGANTRLLLLGDPDQLPPVEGGSLFPELADLFGQKLTRSMRMGDDLNQLASAILRGETVPYENVEWEKIIDALVSILPNPVHQTQPDPHLCLEDQKRFRVLCVLRQGPLGVDTLNQQLLAHYRQKAGYLAIPILITQNDPRHQLYNGTTGVLIKGTAYFDGRSLPEGVLPQYETAFCLSVHKSQGSEYNEVVALFPPGSERFGKEALYTAFTRAKKKVTLFSDTPTLQAALNISARRRSGFTERFGEISKPTS